MLEIDEFVRHICYIKKKVFDSALKYKVYSLKTKVFEINKPRLRDSKCLLRSHTTTK